MPRQDAVRLPIAGHTSAPKRPEVWPRNAPSQVHVMAKPTGAICNLDCKYCFFLDKEALYPGSRFRMGDDVLEAYVRQVIESHRTPEITIAWQGGEPTLMGLPFFRRVMDLVREHQRAGTTITHTVQTNGTVLTDEWCELFRENRVLVGLSMDGPRALHDAYRVDKGGAPTFDKVMRAARRMQRHGVDFNILCTVHAANGDHPLEVYRFFRDELGTDFVQLIPIVERATSGDELVTERSVRPEQWGEFLIAVFDEWLRRDVGKVFVQMFESTLASFLGMPASMCVFAETCGDALALEHNGDLYSCDHFVEPEHLLGNIRESHLLELVASEQQRAFGRAKRDGLPRYCRECEVRFACNGECPRNRFATTPDGEPGLNYLCADYKAFFTHVATPMRVMGQLLRLGRDPAQTGRVLDAVARRGR